jgi:hypothetical protein
MNTFLVVLCVYIIGMPVFAYCQARWWGVTKERWLEAVSGGEDGDKTPIMAVVLWPLVTPFALVMRAISASVNFAREAGEEAAKKRARAVLEDEEELQLPPKPCPRCRGYRDQGVYEEELDSNAKMPDWPIAFPDDAAQEHQ